ncbi:hypothetical protein EDI_201370 [Entamoeba dispar SAW760]|uniref:Uncharacterized protein n=1 Tax=Entamoeba dispar (strain ATCC PRA-260 / SAW760) TaxID=370354 RepID=B0ETU5_ENTDS|nr:uncharacterized protein EDI_201370 [Entamoeba dispar SAW760]EDR22021.1 hypothetical protein EDI_201370 [Entamoeba dispar SAW760]|eukprot:EDR22021.1 hypothetical protein EDI_201370 [Entamoeba dispar SAW760]
MQNKEIERLYLLIGCIQYPMKLVCSKEYIERKKREHSQFLQNYKLEVNEPWFKEITELPWYNDHNLINQVISLIKQGKLAPVCEMVESDDDNEMCFSCLCKPKNNIIGLNWIHCSPATSNHLICTPCLLNTLSSNGFKISLNDLTCECQICKKVSPLIYHEPSDETILKEVPMEELQTKIVYGRRGEELNSNL